MGSAGEVSNVKILWAALHSNGGKNSNSGDTLVGFQTKVCTQFLVDTFDIANRDLPNVVPQILCLIFICKMRKSTHFVGNCSENKCQFDPTNHYKTERMVRKYIYFFKLNSTSVRLV